MNDTAATQNGAAPAASTPGEGPMTFDKMISGKVSSSAKSPIGDPDKTPPPVEEEGGEEEVLEYDDGGSDESGETDSSDDEGGEEGSSEGETGDESGEEGEDSEEDGSEEAAVEELAKLDGPGKTVEAKIGDKTVKVPLSMKVDFTTKDGTVHKGLSLKEVLNNYVTSSEVSKKLTQLDTEKKSFQSEKREAQRIQLEHEEMEESLSMLREAAEGRNMFDMAQAVLHFFAKGDGNHANELFAQVKALTEQVGEWDEATLKTKINQSQLDFKNKALSRENQKKDAQLAKTKQRTYIDGLISSEKISMDEYREGWGLIKKADERRKAAGQPTIINDSMNFEQIAQKTVEFVHANKIYNRVVKVVHRLAPKRIQDGKLIETIAGLTERDFSDKDVEDIVRGVLKIPAKKKIATQPQKEASSSTDTPPSNRGKESTKKTEANPKEKEKRSDGVLAPMTFDRMLGKA